MWWCKCICGENILVSTYSLMSGNTRSCGCLRREMARERESNDVTGQQFGRLKAIEPTNQRDNHSVVWRWGCACGNEIVTGLYRVTSGHIRSCGCLQMSTRITRNLPISPDEIPYKLVHLYMAIAKAKRLLKNG